jgi:serine/threonine protein kinase
MIAFACPACGRTLRVSDEQAGKKARCPSCAAISPILPLRPAPVAIEKAPVPPAPIPTATYHPAPGIDEQEPLPPTVDYHRAAVKATLDHAAISIPGYEILGELGRGGMGVVYQARQTKLNRVVALKMILHADHAGPNELARFRTEAEAIARLNHPNIVQIFDIGEHDGKPFFSLEYCPGGSLSGRLKQEQLPPREAAALVETLALAMQAAHDAHVIHRDLKPHNVLLLADGTPKITDFGLAKKLEIEEGKTRTGAIMGTPSYMAPEQAAGKKQVGPPADIYALGAILYQLLTERPPFLAKTPLDTILKVLNDEVIPPRRINAKLPRDLETICLKCLHKEPGKRYASAAALAEDLRCFLDGKPIGARRTGPIEKAWRWSSTHPTAALLLAVVAVGTGFTTLRQYDLFNTDEVKLPSSPIIRPPYQPKLPPKERQPDRPMPPPAWHLACTLSGSWGRLWTVTFAPDGSRLAGAGEDGSIRLWDIATNKRDCWQPGHDDTVLCLAFSPDGRWLASGGADKVVMIWNADSGRKERNLEGHRHSVQALSFDPSGRFLATASRDRTAILWDTSTWNPLLTLKEHERGVNTLAFSPDGTLLATASDDRTIRIYSVPEGSLRHTLRGHTDRVTAVSFVSCSKRLLSVGWDQRILEWDVVAGRRAEDNVLNPGFRIRFNTLATAPADSLVAAGGWGGQVLVAGADGPRSLLTGSAEQTTSLAFSKDGKRLAAAGSDRVVRVWMLTAGPPLLPAR